MERPAGKPSIVVAGLGMPSPGHGLSGRGTSTRQLLFSPPVSVQRVREWELPPAGVPSSPQTPSSGYGAPPSPSIVMKSWQRRADASLPRPRTVASAFRGADPDPVAGMTSVEARAAERRKKGDHRRPAHMCGHRSVTRVDAYPDRPKTSVSHVPPDFDSSPSSVAAAMEPAPRRSADTHRLSVRHGSRSSREHARRRLKKAMSAASISARGMGPSSPSLSDTMSVTRLRSTGKPEPHGRPQTSASGPRRRGGGAGPVRSGTGRSLASTGTAPTRTGTLPRPRTGATAASRPVTSHSSRSRDPRMTALGVTRPESLARRNRLAQSAESSGYWQAAGASHLSVAGITMFNEAHVEEGGDGSPVEFPGAGPPRELTFTPGLGIGMGGLRHQRLGVVPEPTSTRAPQHPTRILHPGEFMDTLRSTQRTGDTGFTSSVASATTGADSGRGFDDATSRRLFNTRGGVQPQGRPMTSATDTSGWASTATPDLGVHGWSATETPAKTMRELLRRVSDTVYGAPRGVHGAFKKISDGGSVDCRALYHGLRKLGCPVTEQEAAAMLDSFDIDMDGVLSQSEFVHMLSSAA